MTPNLPAWERQFTRLVSRAGGPDPTATIAALPAAYTALTPPALALRDVLRSQCLSSEQPFLIELWRATCPAGEESQRLQIYSINPIALDEVMPYLQNLHLRIFDQVGFTLSLSGHNSFIHSFFVAAPGADALPLRWVKPLLLDALMALLAGRVENDSLNGLLTLMGLPWQDIDLFRAYRNYYCQWNPRCSHERFHEALHGNPRVVQLLFGYFEARFRPDLALAAETPREEEVLPAIRQELGAALQEVADGGADRILRDLFNLIDATLRTNHYLRRAEPERCLALKMDSQGIFAMPSPKPSYEIYVHSPAMEGIHLRGAKVARGGIRWSDRVDDFRDEILDLMQTQMIKNALIVPHGAKGGFIVKTPGASPREMQRHAQAAYKTLIQGLLDLTDNRDASGCFRPPGVIAYDNDDPYLVVAADKGTATFSDLANAIAVKHRFWLGDAFASGGSRGYDHKMLGITARGAWECIRRHFAELGSDPQRQPFTVVGVGSMDGDVFGNGMLLSRHTRLLGAFAARHIFLDPDPDPELSFQERLRLFRLEGSNWTDYDPALISPGGGVFPRAAKDIPLSAPVRQWLGIRRACVDGEELVRLLLGAPVDLLWLGGIGTYVKASSESHDEVGDRANDSVRVDACQLRAKIVGEGANLGFTQQARIEYALAGGRINTDAVDNSAGVDLSDHEVNLKILMAQLEEQGLLGAQATRYQWLEAVQEEVCASVLTHNREQSLCLSLDSERCARNLEAFLDTADYLATAGHLDRRALSFPSRKETMAREGRRLTRPDLAILMPCCKLALKQALLESDDFIERWKHDALYADYFPPAIREHFAAQLPLHSLSREIAVSQVANWIINRAGSAFLSWGSGLDADALRKQSDAYLAFDRVFNCEQLRIKIHAGCSQASAEQRYRLLIGVEAMLALCCLWQVRRGVAPHTGPEFIGRRQQAVRDYLAYLETAHRGHGEPLSSEPSFVNQWLHLEPSEMRLLSSLEVVADFPALVELGECTGAPMELAADTYFRLAQQLGIAPVLETLAAVDQADYWERRGRTEAAFRLRVNLMRLTAHLITAGTKDGAAFFAKKGRRAESDRFKRLCRELGASTMVRLNGVALIAMEFETLLDQVQDTSRT